jgi:hypothetical protein
MASQYPQAPPTYQPASPYRDAPEAGPASPLLGRQSRGGAGGIYDMPEAGDLPDDFKVRLIFDPELWNS